MLLALLYGIPVGILLRRPYFARHAEKMNADILNIGNTIPSMAGIAAADRAQCL